MGEEWYAPGFTAQNIADRRAQFSTTNSFGCIQANPAVPGRCGVYKKVTYNSGAANCFNADYLIAGALDVPLLGLLDVPLLIDPSTGAFRNCAGAVSLASTETYYFLPSDPPGLGGVPSTAAECGFPSVNKREDNIDKATTQFKTKMAVVLSGAVSDFDEYKKSQMVTWFAGKVGVAYQQVGFM